MDQKERDLTIKQMLLIVAKNTQSKKKVEEASKTFGCYGGKFFVNYIWNIAKMKGLVD